MNWRDHSLMYPDAAGVVDVYGKGKVGIVHFDSHYDAGQGNAKAPGSPEACSTACRWGIASARRWISEPIEVPMVAAVPRVSWMSRRYALLLSFCAVVGLHGCSTTPVSAPAPVAPSLTLLDAQPLVLAEDCQSSGSVFVEFKVLSNGRTGDIRAPQGPVCVQQALTAWVSSFRYAPPAVETAAGIEWLQVTATRTGS